MITVIASQIILGIIFLTLTLLVFTSPAIFFLKRFNLKIEDGLERFTLSTVIGIVIFTLTAYMLAALHLRFLMYIFPFLGFWYFKKTKEFNNFRLSVSRKFIFTTVFLIGVIGQVAVNAPSGLPYKDGIYFWSAHGHDGIWHLSLMEEMHKGFFPFQNPEYATHRLQNYHFFVDLLMSEFSRLFYFSDLDIFFRFMPILFSVLLGLSSFILVRAWSKSETAGIWGMIFTYFAGSFGYLLYIPTHKNLGGESIFWLSQTQSILGNPPHAAAFIITTTFLFILLKYINNRKLEYFLISALLGGAVIGFKVYAGILILWGLIVLGLYELIFKKDIRILLLFCLTFLIAFIIYFPNSNKTQDFLFWQPWWFIRTMVVAPDRLNWLDLELRRQTYLSEHNWKRVVQVEATAFLIFLFGNLGMRFIGFLTIFKQLKENVFNNPFNLLLLTVTLTSFFIPVFFLQRGLAWNSIQFNQYFLLFFGFYAALAIQIILLIFKIRSWKLATIIIILAIPTQIGLLWQFYSNPALSKISYDELKALDFLKAQAKETDIILVAPFNKYERDKYSYPPIPIYAWYDTGYVSAFSSKPTLLSDEEQINIMGYKDLSRLMKEREEAFESKDYHVMNSFLKNNNIDYIYLAWDQKIATDSSFLNTDLIFKNQDARIYKIKK